MGDWDCCSSKSVRWLAQEEERNKVSKFYQLACGIHAQTSKIMILQSIRSLPSEEVEDADLVYFVGYLKTSTVV